MPPICNLIPPQYRSRLLSINPNLHDRNHLIRRDPEHLMAINPLNIPFLIGSVAVKHSHKYSLVVEKIRPAD